MNHDITQQMIYVPSAEDSEDHDLTMPDDDGMHPDFTGLQEQIGVSIPITSGQYLGLSRSGFAMPTHSAVQSSQDAADPAE